MTNYDVFNGDADGICALIQLRKAEPRDAILVTGVKRDINLLAKVDAAIGDQITVLDVSMDKNKEDLRRVLKNGASVFYADHHFAGDVPEHENLYAIINEGAEVCTAVLINGHLKGAFPDWAVVGAFGDNFKKTARKLAQPLNLSAVDLESLEKLGIYVNYNGYGSSVKDLHFNPEDLYQTLFEADSALEFITSSPDYQKLRIGYAEDMAKAAELRPIHCEEATAVFKLPNAAWSLRVRGVYGNDLAMQNPNRAHAVVTEKDSGNYLVSVRAPINNRQGAAELCMQFPTGGGRTAAAGINDLPHDELDTFIKAFTEAY